MRGVICSQGSVTSRGSLTVDRIRSASSLVSPAACRIVKISLQSLFCQVIAVKTAFPVFIDRVENAVFRILVLSPDPPLNSLSVDGDGALDKPFRNLHALLGG